MGCHPSICSETRGLFDLAGTDTSTQAGGVFVRSVALLTQMYRAHAKQTHMDHIWLHSWQTAPFRRIGPN